MVEHADTIEQRPSGLSLRASIAFALVVLAASTLVIVLVQSGNGNASTAQSSFQAPRQLQQQGTQGGFGRPDSGSSADGSFQQFAQCLSDHGVTLPSPGTLPDVDPSGSTFQQALQACAQYAPSHGAGPRGLPGQSDPGLPGGQTPQTPQTPSQDGSGSSSDI
jgi:hypothetical protein